MMENMFDEKTGLAWKPQYIKDSYPDNVSTFATARLLMPLLQSGEPDNREVAIRAIDVLLDCQYNCPGLPHHGSWRRFPSENPPDHALHWIDFDPNFREFVGTALVCAIQDFEDLLTGPRIERIELALQRAAVGTIARELTPDYSNIAILQAFLMASLGKRFGREDWLLYGAEQAEKVCRLFRRHNCFDEFNSPTYYGLDLDGLALWIERPPVPVFAEYGRNMEHLLWLEIAEFYHAGLKNLCGPFDRAYTLDLQDNNAPLCLGAVVNAIVGAEKKPFDIDPVQDNLVQRVPAEARHHFESFQGERLIERIITDTPHRVATAWLSENLMIGAEDASQTKLVWEQYHMATMHWRLPDGSVGCLRLIPTMPTDAKAEPGRLSTWTYVWAGSGTTDVSFCWDIQCPGLTPNAIEDDVWHLPGLELSVKTNARDRQVSTTEIGISVHFNGNNRDAGTWLRFEFVTRNR